jgi:hypothetical protein
MPLIIDRTHKKLLARQEGFDEIALPTVNEVNNELATRASRNELYGALANRITDSQLSDALANRITDSQLSDALANRITDSQLSAALAGIQAKISLNATTTGAAPATLSIVVPIGKFYTGTINVAAINLNGSAARYIRQFSVKNINGVISLVGPASSIGEDEPAGTSVNISTSNFNYRYYRFVPTELRDFDSSNSVQISEFQMLFDGSRIAGAVASAPSGQPNIPNEGPEQGNDNNLETKWLDFAKTSNATLVLDFGVNTLASGYRWATANDTASRDPVSWRVDGSYDGLEWIILDERTNFSTPIDRKTYLNDFTFSGHISLEVTGVENERWNWSASFDVTEVSI